MHNHFRRLLFTRAARLFDLSTVSLAFVVAFAVSSGTFSWPTLAEFLLVRIKVVNMLVFCGYLLLCLAIFSTCGLYLSHRLSPWTRQVREILLATGFIAGIPFALPFKITFVTVEFFVIYWLLTFSFLVLSRVVGYPFLYYLRTRGRNLRHLVIVGEGADAVALANRIEQEPTFGYRVLRIINTNDADKVEAEVEAKA